MADDVALFAPDVDWLYLPTSEESGFLQGVDRSAYGRRVEIARLLANPESPFCVITSAMALLEESPDPESLQGRTLSLSKGAEKDRDEIAAALAEGGFERVPIVERAGQFAVRGGVVDLYCPLASEPLRIEMFGDEIDSLRSFDPVSQRSIREHQHIEVTLTHRDDVEDHLREARPPLLKSLSDEVELILRDRKEVGETAQRHEGQMSRAKSKKGGELARTLDDRAQAFFERLPVDASDGEDFDIGGIEARGSDMEAAIETLDGLSAKGKDLLLCFTTEAEQHRFWEALEEEAEPLLAESLRARNLGSRIGTLFKGFRLRDSKIAVVNHRELFDIAFQRRPKARRIERPETRAIDDFVDLEEGDYVVHVAHGIGRFIKVETIVKGGETQEFLVLEYRNELLLYVPVAQTDLVQKYIGGKSDGPRLSTIGGRSWKKKKMDVFHAVEDLAADMIESQAARERSEGYAFPPDGAWQHEFEAAFPYEETPDQLAAIEAIREDMEAAKPMDRLICGDVGYGKTEVAMRAAFKAVMAGKQVAILVPTTVLAEQHFKSFHERMGAYPVRIRCLNRFRTHREQQETILELVEGRVDIVIGTHRLVSKDVAFKDLGLVVIDEEQRFGVTHKERLRTMRKMVDIITLTATPIPRTLHLSLLGIRDISSLTQAPRGRQPVQTKIVRYDEDLIRKAVLHELERGGQCYFVHNRVKTIERIRKDLRRIVPEAEVLVIHGQLRGEEIEHNLTAFVKREADLLLATTIIESGLDIPTANTIFIDRPDMYGLADLHQLRGRVGRQRDKAFAWLLLRPDTILTGDAEKRMRAIEEFDDLGSGFRIAMRDLEIRGAGNLLGAQQHGHIEAVGYDMYCRLLDAAVKKLKRERSVLPDEVDLSLDFEAFLPSDWILDPKVKLEAYRKLGRAARDDDFRLVVEELSDRFGRLPAMAIDFVDICRIRALAERLRLKRVASSKGRGILLRPEDLRDLRRRLAVTRVEHRVIGNKDVLLVHPARFERPCEALGLLEKALLPNRKA